MFGLCFCGGVVGSMSRRGVWELGARRGLPCGVDWPAPYRVKLCRCYTGERQPRTNSTPDQEDNAMLVLKAFSYRYLDRLFSTF